MPGDCRQFYPASPQREYTRPRRQNDISLITGADFTYFALFSPFFRAFFIKCLIDNATYAQSTKMPPAARRKTAKRLLIWCFRDKAFGAAIFSSLFCETGLLDMLPSFRHLMPAASIVDAYAMRFDEMLLWCLYICWIFILGAVHYHITASKPKSPEYFWLIFAVLLATSSHAAPRHTGSRHFIDVSYFTTTPPNIVTARIRHFRYFILARHLLHVTP